MAFFVLNSEITIGSFQFSGAHEVRIRRSMRDLTDTATITVPSICKIAKGTQRNPLTLVTGRQFKDGDAVTIKLGYNGDLQTEFQGFVKRRNLNMPLEVECEGYSYLMRQLAVTGNYKSISVSDLLGLATNGTGITVQCDNKTNFISVPLNQNNGIQIVDFIKKFSDGALTCYFIKPTTLWCGLPYTALANGSTPFELPQVSYRLGYNVVKDNNLKERIPSEPVQVIINGKLVTGQRVFTASMYKSAQRKVKSLQNHIGDNASLQANAQEKEYQHNYLGYEGNINAFLQPFCWPGWTANVVDDRYPERNGVYIIEGTDVTYGQKGARRIVTLGPLIGFGANYGPNVPLNDN